VTEKLSKQVSTGQFIGGSAGASRLESCGKNGEGRSAYQKTPGNEWQEPKASGGCGMKVRGGEGGGGGEDGGVR